MSYDKDFDSQWRDAAEDRAVGAVDEVLVRISLIPLVVAGSAIALVGGVLATAYLCAVLSLGVLDGARWWVAVVYLSAGHLLAVFRFGWLRCAVGEGLRANYPVPSGRQILNSRAAWLTRLGLASLAALAVAHLVATGLPAAFVVVIAVVTVLSLDIVELGTWPARRLLAHGMGPLS